VVQVAPLGQVDGVEVVGGQQDPGGVVLVDQGQEVLQVRLGAAFAQHQVHPPVELLLGLRDAGALMVGGDAEVDVGVERLAGQQRRMAVGTQAPGLDVRQLLQHLGVAVDRPGHVHHLAEGDEPGVVEERPQLGRPHVGGEGLELRVGDGRYARGNAEVDAESFVMRSGI